MANISVRSARFALLLTAATLLISAAPASAQTLLRWKFRPGQVLDQTIATKLTMPYGTQTIENVVQTDMTWTVGNVDSQGVAEIAQEIKRMRMKISGGPASFEVDSASTETSPGPAGIIAPALKIFAKAKFQMKMNPLGEIVNVEVPQEVIDGIKALPNAEMLAGIFGKDALVDLVKQGVVGLPKESVQQGATWSNRQQTSLGSAGKMQGEFRLKYAGPEKVGDKQLERIDVALVTKIEQAPTNQAINLADQQGQGKLYFDNVAGRIDRYELRVLTVRNGKVDENGQKTQSVIVFKPAATSNR